MTYDKFCSYHNIFRRYPGWAELNPFRLLGDYWLIIVYFTSQNKLAACAVDEERAKKIEEYLMAGESLEFAILATTNQ